MSTPQTWQVVIQKVMDGEYFVNDYHVQAASPTAAKIEALKIVEIEKDIFTVRVGFINFRVRSAASTGQGTVYPLTGAGTVGVTDYYPLYATVRVDLAPEFGRVGRKYLRPPLGMSGGDGKGGLSTAAQTFYRDNYCIPLIALGTVCKPNGQPFVSAGVHPLIQMRQLRRGSKRKAPII